MTSGAKYHWQKRKCVCGAALTPAHELCAECISTFVIRRDPVPGQRNHRPRYFTNGCGWSADIRKAGRYLLREHAELVKHDPDVVVPLAGELQLATQP
jgi:hypothetical protein